MKMRTFLLLIFSGVMLLFSGCKHSMNAKNAPGQQDNGTKQVRITDLTLSGFKDDSTAGWVIIKGTNLAEIDLTKNELALTCANVEFTAKTYRKDKNDIKAECSFKSGFSVPAVVTAEYKEQKRTAAFTEFDIDEDGVLKKGGYGNKKLSGEIIIPSYIKTVDSRAFYDQGKITQLKFEDGCTEIKDEAFNGCTDLTEVAFPATLKTVGEAAFESCTSLKELNLPHMLERIEKGAFRGCKAIEKIDFKDNLSYIGYEAFKDCSALGEISLPKNAREFGTYTFRNCTNLLQVNITGGTAVLSEYMFTGCKSLRIVDISSRLETLPLGIFSDCDELVTVKLPPTLKKIEKDAFFVSGLTNIDIPPAVKSVGERAFAECKNLSLFTINGELDFKEMPFKESGKVLFLIRIRNKETAKKMKAKLEAAGIPSVRIKII